MNRPPIEEFLETCKKKTPGPWVPQKTYHEEPGYEEFIKMAWVDRQIDNKEISTITMQNWSNPVFDDTIFIASAGTHAQSIAEHALLVEKALEIALTKFECPNNRNCDKDILCSECKRNTVLSEAQRQLKEAEQ